MQTHGLIDCSGARPPRGLPQVRGRTGRQPKTALLMPVLALALTSCFPPPLTLAPVGPAPLAAGPGMPASGLGQLQVFTETDEYEVDHDVPFFPHRDYEVCTAEGKRLKRVWNSQSHEDETPAMVSLPPGRYLVKADAEFYGPVTVPVLIAPNALTKVVLQPGWKPGQTVADSQLVRMPEGYFIGWRAGLKEWP